MEEPVNMTVEEYQAHIDTFDKDMLSVLIANDWKGGWKDVSLDDLIGDVYDEVAEIQDAVQALRSIPRVNATARAEARKKVIKEAADVAAYAMMIADNVRDMS